MNKRMQTNNTSGYIGVSWDKRRTKWLAQIAVNHKHINLGRYTNKAAAIAARKAAEKKYFGEFAYSESQDATMQHNPKR